MFQVIITTQGHVNDRYKKRVSIPAKWWVTGHERIKYLPSVIWRSDYGTMPEFTAQLVNDGQFPYLKIYDPLSQQLDETSTLKGAQLQTDTGQDAFAMVRMGPGDAIPSDVKLFTTLGDFLDYAENRPRGSILHLPSQISKILTYSLLFCSLFTGSAGRHAIAEAKRNDFLQTINHHQHLDKMRWIEPGHADYEGWVDDKTVAHMTDTNCYGFVFKMLRMSNCLSSSDLLTITNKSIKQAKSLKRRGSADSFFQQQVNYIYRQMLFNTCHKVDFLGSHPHLKLTGKNVQSGDLIFFSDAEEKSMVHVAIVKTVIGETITLIELGGATIVPSREDRIHENMLSLYQLPELKSMAEKVFLCKLFTGWS